MAGIPFRPDLARIALMAAGLVVGAAALLILLAPGAEATHYRAGTMNWSSESPLPMALGDVSLDVRLTFRASYPWPQPAPQVVGTNLCLGAGGCMGPIQWGDGNSESNYEAQVTDYSAALDTVSVRLVQPGTNQPLRHTYPLLGAASAYLVSWGSCCRMSWSGPMNLAHANNPDQSFALQAWVTPGPPNHSPGFSQGWIADCPSTGVCSLPLPATDADGDPVFYRFATSANATGGGGAFYQPGPCPARSGSPGCGNVTAATIDPSTGTFTWTTTGATVRPAPWSTFYSAQVMADDGHGAVPLDFFIRLLPPPTPTCSPASQTVQVGQAADLFSPNSGVSWSSPTGTPPSATGSTYRPTYSQEGDHDVTVSNGAGSSTCVVHVVPQQPPTCSPASQSAPAGTRVSFTADGGGTSWTAPEGDPSSGAGSTFSTTYPAVGDYTVTVANAAGSAACQVHATPATSPCGYVQDAPYNFTDISANGTALDLRDDYAIPISLPFAVGFCGEGYTTVQASSNGYVCFGTQAPCFNYYPSSAAPSPALPGPAVFGYMTDLYPPGCAGGAQACSKWQVLGTAPHRVFAYMQKGTPFCCTAGTPAVTYEILLHEGAACAEVQYLDVSDPDGSHLVLGGFQDADGTDGGTYAYSRPGFARQGVAWQVGWGCPGAPPPPTPPTCAPATQSVQAGQAASFSSTGEGNVWRSPGGTPASGSGAAYATIYAQAGDYTAEVANLYGSATCAVHVAPAPPTCAPADQQALAGRTVSWASTSEENEWASPGGTPAAGSGRIYSTAYGQPGTYTVTAANESGSATCAVTVVWAAHTHAIGLAANGHHIDATVQAADDAEAPAAGVTVDLALCDAASACTALQGVTDAAGAVTLRIQHLGDGEYALCVTGMAATDWGWDAALGHAAEGNCARVTV